ncbi:RNA polymerase sigma factor, sigma-70 family [Longilinea arvoryzae]|uniref:RNA polymerase sigma factor n=1 Tax=Longilinea arvoryzae TaxID=360412 RepID=A0A0S7BFR1_9CHLR|nr:RNA polymerase sigma factor [Longilinea arvoryzae]GAP13334.1 RNA polymerase sigma factor, sigma-70 family [Longilinea arvoryzae]
MAHTDPPAPDGPELAFDLPAIARLKQGNIDGLEALVQRYQVEAVHAALLIVRDPALAQDIAQEAFLQAYRKIDQFNERRPFRPWLMRIVINAALKAARRRQRFSALEESGDGRRAAEWLIDPALGPESLAETAETRERIWQALGRLAPSQRAAVVLRYFLDETESEMVRDLNRPLTTVKWWLYSARQRLRTLLQPKDGEKTEQQEVDHE